MEKFYKKDIKELFDHFKSSEHGLDNLQYEKNKKHYGMNVIKEKENKSIIKVFFEQFKDMLVIILVISAIISIFLNELESTIVIFVVLTINALLGTYQYQKAQKSLDSLRNLSSPISYVIRNKEVKKIRSYDLVCGDVVIINTGDVISADGRIIEEDGLEINESSLTGESEPVKKNVEAIEKDCEISEQKNMLFSGTFCTKGHAKYIVCNVGMETQIGKIARDLNNIVPQKSPLQNNLNSFSKYLSIIILVICGIIFLINFYRHGSFLDSLMFAVALAVAAIPEALSTIVTIVLAIGTEKMAKENAIIKDLKSVESLGCINVICSDKTGTLTQNNMIVKETINYIEINKFKKYVFLSTNYDQYKVSNNPTENALINYTKDYIDIDYKRIQEIPFSSDRKLMTNLCELDGQKFLFIKGGIDVVLDKCDFIEKDYKEILSIDKKEKILNDVNEYANNGRRIIGFAYKKINKENITPYDEIALTFIGFVTIIDPPRNETINAVKNCLNAGIKPIMLTGDYKNTAIAIAKDIGIYNFNDEVITGEELEKISQKELEEKIDKITVYARLNPNQKIRIVDAWQSKKAVVAMTGDGVNDALALAKSDVSIAMGNGTEVAKDASSMILVDNNFNTIVKAIENGRKIFINIQNAIRFLLSGNFAAILIVFITTFLKLPIPFLAVHLLFINLLTDSLPAIAIGMQNHHSNLLNQKPRNKNNHFVDKKSIIKIIFEGLLIFVFCYLGYLKGLKVNVETARTMAFAILCITRLLHSFNCAINDSFLEWNRLNKFIIYSFIIGLILINSVLFIPFLKNIFCISNLSLNLVLSLYSYSIFPTLIIQFIRLIKK